MRLICGGRTPPLLDGVGHSTVHTKCFFEFSSAMWTGELGEKNIERVSAFAATPKFADGRCSVAGRTGESGAARRVGDSHQRASLLKAEPAIIRDECGHDIVPTVVFDDDIRDQRSYANKADDGRDHHAACPAKLEPEQ